ncbi:hypothetical protein AND4_13511, partial [Vibrio sp. AND4]
IKVNNYCFVKTKKVDAFTSTLVSIGFI